MTAPAASPGPRKQSRRRDGLFLGAVVLLSTALYVGKLGFYSDDWAFLATLHLSPDRSLPGLFQYLYEAPEHRMRPVMFLFLSGLYWLFGLDPPGYHVTNALVLTASALLLHKILGELTDSRPSTPPIVSGLLRSRPTSAWRFIS
jgi:4-amino-4-deoxy-L-arabinose transferase-like glycosyltransferase